MRRCPLTLALAAGALLALAAGAGRARATVGGPELSEALGYDPRTQEVFFRQHHWNAGGYRPTIVRLRPGQGPRLFEPVGWSIGEGSDSAYATRVAALQRRLRPLRERMWGTIPGRITVERRQRVTLFEAAIERWRVRADQFEVEGPVGGSLRVTTYRSPDVRIVRWYEVPGGREVLGVVSFVGVPVEGGYEAQVPVVTPGAGERLVIPDRWHQSGYPAP